MSTLALGRRASPADAARNVARLAARALLRVAIAAFGGAVVVEAAKRILLPRFLAGLIASALGLTRPRPGRLRRIGGIKTPGGAEGVELSAFAVVRDDPHPSPTILVRTPYDKTPLELWAWGLATQGFNVFIQDCRGRFQSTGTQTFAACEDDDGVATIDWLAQQKFPWHDPQRVVMFGISYLGIVQWAAVAGLEGRRLPRLTDGAFAEPSFEVLPVAMPATLAQEEMPMSATVSHPAPRSQNKIAAIAPLFASSRCFDIFFWQGAFSFDFYMRYMHLMTKVRTMKDLPLSLLHIARFDFNMRRHARNTPGLYQLSRKLGVPVLFKFTARPQARFWQNRDYSDALATSPPAFIATGWHDIMLESSLRDYKALVEAHGEDHARLLVGPWSHLESILSVSALRTLLRNSIEFLQARTGLADPSDESWQKHSRVRLWVMGSRCHDGGWRDFPSWPPQEAVEQLLLLQPGALVEASETACTSGRGKVDPLMAASMAQSRSRIRYDPLDPTPTCGGTLFNYMDAGEMEQSQLAARRDVVCFDTAKLEKTTIVAGCARLRLVIRASRPHFDLFARLCDVHPSGRSYNVCDGILRRCAPTERSQSHHDMQSLKLLGPDDASTGRLGFSSEVTFELELPFAATAKRFHKGHRIRLIMACGCFPRFARHFGDQEQSLDSPLDIAPCDLEVLHTEQLPSCLWLPVLPERADEPPTPTRRRRKSLVAAALEAQALPQHHMARGTTRELSGALRKIMSDATF